MLQTWTRYYNYFGKYTIENFLKIYVVKIGMKIGANVSTYALCARLIFSTGKNMASPSKLISQMVTYLHTGSHIKPRRVKMRMQIKAGRKEHKKNECHHSGHFCFCVGQELVRGEAAVSLKRRRRRELLNTERRCLVSHCSFFCC